jgi:RecQ-mediated genome instability protein 1
MDVTWTRDRILMTVTCLADRVLFPRVLGVVRLAVMGVPVEVTHWLEKTYPKPKVAPEWLRECYDWIVTTHNLSPSDNLHAILDHVEMQLLNSDLRDSVLPETGLPTDVLTWQSSQLSKPGVLVEVAALTEIGHSAFSLLQVRERRIESEGVVGLEEEASGGGLPKYPRSMLRFELTDGTVTIPAIEYRSLPQLELGETPLGYKVCFPPLASLRFSVNAIVCVDGVEGNAHS